MKILLFAITLLITAISSIHAADWKLVWADEFNYQGLPDTNKWGYEEGFVRNHESQYYTRSRLANARVENGNLVRWSSKSSARVLDKIIEGAAEHRLKHIGQAQGLARRTRQGNRRRFARILVEVDRL